MGERTYFDRELDFLAQLRTEITAAVDGPLGEQLFVQASADFLAGPSGSHAMFERWSRFQSKV